MSKFKEQYGDDIEFTLKTFIRAVIVAGLVFFSNCLANGTLHFKGLEPAFIASGIYFFIELARKYQIDYTNITRTKKEFGYILFP